MKSWGAKKAQWSLYKRYVCYEIMSIELWKWQCHPRFDYVHSSVKHKQQSFQMIFTVCLSEASSLIPWRKRKRRLFYLQIQCVLWCIAWSKEGALAQEGTMILLQERCLPFTRSMELWGGGGDCDCVHSSYVKHKATFLSDVFLHMFVQSSCSSTKPICTLWSYIDVFNCLHCVMVPVIESWAHCFAFVTMQLATEWSFAYNLKPNILSLLALMPRSPEIFATMPESSSLLNCTGTAKLYDIKFMRNLILRTCTKLMETNNESKSIQGTNRITIILVYKFSNCI